MPTIQPQMLVQPQPLREVYVVAQEIYGPSSYTTGGVVLSPNTFALRFFKAIMTAHESPDGTYYARFVAPAGPTFGDQVSTEVKMVWYVTATNAEVAAATNLSTESIRVVAIGN